MLAKLEMKLNTNETIVGAMASVFHGALMEQLSDEYATMLHESRLHPYAQHLEKIDGQWYWVVSVLNTQAKVNIIDRLIQLDEITIKRNGLNICISEKNYIEESDEAIAQSFYREKASKYIQIQFVTPTAFKKNGVYINYPDIGFIYSNLMKRYDSAKIEDSMYDEDTLEELIKNTVLSRYELNGIGFSLEGIRIPAFMGRMTLRMNGTQTMANFAHMLFRYGTYSGIGIKTALGMGAIKILEGGKDVTS